MLPFGIGFSEVLLILVVVLLVVGPSRLPEVAKTVAKGLRTVRNAGKELRDAIDIEEVRDLRRSLYDPVEDWRKPEPIEDAQIAEPEVIADAPAEKAPLQDPPIETIEDAPDEALDAPVARDPFTIVRKDERQVGDDPDDSGTA